MIEKIETTIIWEGRKQGTTWFHPRPCMLPHPDGNQCVMTCQSISGSDVFGPVHCSVSSDQGRTWPVPQPIPGLGRKDLPNNMQEGVCDVVPEYHPGTDTILAIGHNVFYKHNVLTQPGTGRYPVYAIRSRDEKWTARARLEWHDVNVPAMYTCGCAQRVTLQDGRILIPLSVGTVPDKPRSVCSVCCAFDGTNLSIAEISNPLHISAGRGLLEPSLVFLAGHYYMTIRAEDGHGYVTVSDTGLRWEEPRPWCWDDGEPLRMSTTQQHWIAHSQGLFLVYTRQAKANVNVMRWRAPLYISQVDTKTMRLIRTSEKIIFSLIGDGINNADQVARMGNFHTVNASPEESWVTVGETLPKDDWRGNTLLARITWTSPNNLMF